MYARVVRFTDANPDRIAGIAARVRGGRRGRHRECVALGDEAAASTSPSRTAIFDRVSSRTEAGSCAESSEILGSDGFGSETPGSSRLRRPLRRSKRRVRREPSSRLSTSATATSVRDVARPWRRCDDPSMRIAILIFDKLTALDAVGPYEVLSRLPGAELSFVAKEAGTEAHRHRRARINADARPRRAHRSRDRPRPRRRGQPATARRRGGARLASGAPRHQTWTTSVCTGSLVLGAAVILEGKRATSHWVYRDRWRTTAPSPSPHAWSSDGKLITAAGVSAGIDMALTLAARDRGR